VAVLEGETVSLLALFYSPMHKFNLTWYNPAGEVAGDGAEHVVINADISNDWGIWEVKACDVIGCGNQYIFLHVQGIVGLLKVYCTLTI